MVEFDEYIQDRELADKITQLVQEIDPEQDPFVCRLVEEFDEDGVPSWSIDLCYRLSNTPIKTKDTAKLIFRIREFLFGRGDNRFPYIYHNLEDNQPVATAC